MNRRMTFAGLFAALGFGSAAKAAQPVVEISSETSEGVANHYHLRCDHAGKCVWAIKVDGTVEFGPGFTPDEQSRRAAKIFAGTYAAEVERCRRDINLRPHWLRFPV